MKYNILESKGTGSINKNQQHSKTDYILVWSFNKIEDFQAFIKKKIRLKQNLLPKHRTQENQQKVIKRGERG